MSAPLATVGPGAYGFEALLEMTRRGIHHLVVMEAGRLVGVVSSHDFLRVQATHPVAVSREIRLARSVDDLARLGARVTALVGRLVSEGGTPYDVGRIVAELNDQILQRVLELVSGPGGAARPAAGPVLLARLRQRGPPRADAPDRPGQRARVRGPAAGGRRRRPGLLRAPRRRDQRGARARRLPGMPRADHGLQPGVVPAGERLDGADSGTGCRRAARRRCFTRASSSISARSAGRRRSDRTCRR